MLYRVWISVHVATARVTIRRYGLHGSAPGQYSSETDSRGHRRSLHNHVSVCAYSQDPVHRSAALRHVHGESLELS